MSFTTTLSGIILNQNATVSSTIDWQTTFGGNWLYQTFTLPTDYPRGTVEGEVRIPDLSGFQVMVEVDFGGAPTASLNYQMDYYNDNEGWRPLTSGQTLGTPYDGRVWFDVIFPESVPISTVLLDKQFRLGIQTNDTLGIRKIPYVTPTPLLFRETGQGQVYQPDGFTTLLPGVTACLNFRLLSMVADSGVNFLGNEYRSCVIQSSPGNVSTTDGVNPVIGTGEGAYWMSPPMPSRFAVQSLYFDVRPVAASPAFGAINGIGNPSFEYDAIGVAPMWWKPYAVGGGTIVDRTVRTTWASHGTQALHTKYTFSAANQELGVASDFQTIAAMTGSIQTPVSIAVDYNLIATTQAALHLTLWFYDSTQTLITSAGGTQTVSTNTPATIGTLTNTVTVPANAVYMKYGVRAVSSAAGSLEAYVDAVQTTLTSTVLPYFDGDMVNNKWIAQKGNSPSAQIIEPTTDSNSVVIDGIAVDPLTPNMAFNVYFSQDDAFTSNNMIESDWEQKLWTRVPQVYICNQRQQYVFPRPILAKYLKIEFTNLQSRAYNPGDFQKPIQYKKFPTWVANYFLLQLQLPSFVASHVSVEYDALRFAYDYYLDDLDQSPAQPIAPPTSLIPQLTNYFNANATTGVDSITLSKINLVMNSFTTPLASNVDTTSTLGSFVSNLMNSANAPPVQAESTVLDPLDLSIVSSLQREAVLFEQTLPVMYFFIPCRHTYKELSAPLEFNRAYFAGVNSISFLRNDYTIATDTPLYIESGGDAANIALNDFVFEPQDQNWYTY